MVRAVAVYCSSSNRVASHFVDAAAEMGRAIALNKWKLVYGGNSVGNMAVLADALEESGCCDEQILSHCRGPGPHVRGCFVIDLLLNKT